MVERSCKFLVAQLGDPHSLLVDACDLVFDVIMSDVCLHLVWQHSELILKNISHQVGNHVLAASLSAAFPLVIFFLSKLRGECASCFLYFLLLSVELDWQLSLVPKKRVVGGLNFGHVLVRFKWDICFLLEEHFYLIFNIFYIFG